MDQLQLHKETYADLLKIKEMIKNKNSKYRKYSICNLMCEFDSTFSKLKLIKNYTNDWPMFSGDKVYPIPSFRFSSPKLEFDKQSTNLRVDYWNEKTKYGCARRSLLNWLTAVIEIRIEQLEDS